MEDSLPWPPQPQDLKPGLFQIPQCLKEFMDNIFENRPERLKYSIAQDIVYGVSNGRIKTPKSILLPTMVKSLTNNTEVIKTLNRLGHGLSYTMLMETQTENAYQIVEEQFKNGCIIPRECQKDKFTIFVADNIDRQEETLSGSSLTFFI